MADPAGPARTSPDVYSIAAHRGFADALVAGLVPRYSEEGLGLGRLTLLLPSARAARTVTEAFIRLMGTGGQAGMLLPRMAVVGDLDLDDTLGPLLDPLRFADIPPAIDATERLFVLADILRREMGKDAPPAPAILKLARDFGQTMDRLLVEEVTPDELLSDRVLTLFGDLAGHWQESLHRFATVQRHWLAELERRGAVDAATRRNLLFDGAARAWKADPPETPIVAAGVTSASPSLARLLKVVSELPQGAVILPDLDLTMDSDVWDELGRAGARPEPDDTPFAKDDAPTHPQYHLKLLLNRMGIARGEVRPWHRKGMTAAPPERSHAIGSLFLPPKASTRWIDLPAEKRRLSGVRLMESAAPEEEAQAIALMAREALETSERRVAIVTPDRGLARRIVHHLRRWNIEADDSAGRELSQTPAGRLLLLLAEVLAEDAAPVPLVALLGHPLVRRGDGEGTSRGDHLKALRAFDKELRGPRPAAGLEPLSAIAAKAGVAEWWQEMSAILAPLLDMTEATPLADSLDALVAVGEALCGEALWALEDGRALSSFIEDWRMRARETGFALDARDLHTVLQDALAQIAVRPPYGGHPRIAIYGLLEARMSRADMVICAGLNEGSWPARSGAEPLLAPAVLRALGVPASEFRIGLAAHDLAGALGAPEVVLSRSQRDADGPAIASRFWLRVKALLGGDLGSAHSEVAMPAMAAALDRPAEIIPATQPHPMPSAEQRKVSVSVTALDRLRSDPYQFYASQIMGLRDWDGLDAEPTPAWQGELAHDILERWHKGEGDLRDIALRQLDQMNAHPLTRHLWQPRLLRALEWVEDAIGWEEGREPVLFEEKGEITHKGVTINGRIDRLDRLADGSFVVIDYKTGRPPSGSQVEAGYALQLGTLGIMLEEGGFGARNGKASAFEYWSLGRNKDSETGFGYIDTPLKIGRKRSGIVPEDFMPQARKFLDEALDHYILGSEPFTARLNPDAPGYDTYDQLMRLEEWLGRDADGGAS